PQGGQLDNHHNEDREERRSATRSRRTNSRRQTTGNPSQAQSTNTPPRQRNREGRPSQANEEVNQHRLNREDHQRDRLAMRAEDVEKLVNNRLRDLKIGGNFEDALRIEVDRANSSPFTVKIEQAAPPKRFSTPSFTCFKGDSNPESHLKHFKSLMILYKAEDALMCKVFAMTLRGAAQDWFHTLPSWSINSFKELTYVFTKEYTSYRTIKKNPDHLFNLRKKPEESLRDYIKRFKAEKANIVGCDDQIASSAFKKGLPAEHDLYRELTITPSQTLAEVFATAERYALWDDDRIAAKKSTEQEDRPAKRAEQRSDRLGSRDKDKGRPRPQREATTKENYTKFSIPIHQILAQ
ncbi:PREDICTED: VITISV_032574, partial [Prunus dulcis]